MCQSRFLSDDTKLYRYEYKHNLFSPAKERDSSQNSSCQWTMALVRMRAAAASSAYRKGQKRHWMVIVYSDDEDSNDPDDAENSVLLNTHPPYKFRKEEAWSYGHTEEPMHTD